MYCFTLIFMPLFKENPIVKKTIERRRKELITRDVKFKFKSIKITDLKLFLSKEYENYKVYYNSFVFDKLNSKNEKVYGKNIRGLIYDVNFKKLLSENKGVIYSFLKLVRNKSLKKIKDPNGRYLISLFSKSRLYFMDKYSSYNTISAYFLILKDKANKIHRFYIKEGVFERSPSSFEEFIALRLIKQKGVDIIYPKLAYFSKESRDISYLKSHNFMCLDYTNLQSVDSLYRSKYNRLNGILTFDEFHKIEMHLSEIKNNLIKVFKEMDIENKIIDINSKNTLIDIDTKKLFIIDPMFSENFENNSKETVDLFNKLKL